MAAGQLMQDHRPARFDGDVLFFSSALDHPANAHGADSWAPYVSGEITDVAIAAHHGEMMSAGALQHLGPELVRRLNIEKK